MDNQDVEQVTIYSSDDHNEQTKKLAQFLERLMRDTGEVDNDSN